MEKEAVTIVGPYQISFDKTMLLKGGGYKVELDKKIVMKKPLKSLAVAWATSELDKKK